MTKPYTLSLQPALPLQELAITRPWRVLIADDDPSILRLLEISLSEAGYDVLSVGDGHELVSMAQERAPNLILVDLAMPRMDGYEAIRQMRNDTRTAHIPMLILTARSGSRNVVIGFETGADDYIAKPFDITELLARIKSHLRRSTQRPVLNPLTGLAGGVLLTQEIRRRLNHAIPFALLYVDLDNFKVFNDTYGFSHGDQAILFVASLIQQVMAVYSHPDHFIGHIGGDDFAILVGPERIDTICDALITAFDSEVWQLYTAEDRQRGYISGVDRYGTLRRFGLMTLSIGVVNTAQRTFHNDETLTRVAAEMKQYAKGRVGSNYTVDQRAAVRSAPLTHSKARRVVLLMSNDVSLCRILRSVLYDAGYIIYEVDSIDAARHWIHTSGRSARSFVLADAELGAPVWDLCAEHAVCPSQAPAMIVLTYTEQDAHRAHTTSGITMSLRMPLPIADMVDALEQLANSRMFDR